MEKYIPKSIMPPCCPTCGGEVLSYQLNSTKTRWDIYCLHCDNIHELKDVDDGDLVQNALPDMPGY